MNTSWKAWMNDWVEVWVPPLQWTHQAVTQAALPFEKLNSGAAGRGVRGWRGVLADLNKAPRKEEKCWAQHCSNNLIHKGGGWCNGGHRHHDAAAAAFISTAQLIYPPSPSSSSAQIKCVCVSVSVFKTNLFIHSNLLNIKQPLTS